MTWYRLLRAVWGVSAGTVLLAQGSKDDSSISGRVVNSVTGAGIAGVKVTLTSPSQRYDATTGETGEFLFNFVEPGSYHASLFGIAAGVVGSRLADRTLRAVFPARTEVDFVAYLLVTPALLAITMLAAYVPARRASRVDPMQAPRYE